MTVPLVGFTRESVQPPSRFYLRPAERFQIRSWCSVAGIVLEIHGLLLMPNGEVQEISETHIPNADRSVATDRYSLPECYLLHLQVRIKTGSLSRGQCFISTGIIRGHAGATVLVASLFADYVTNTTFPTYPRSPLSHSIAGPGSIRSITGTDPAANVEISEAVPAGARWTILAVRFALVTDAGVANRLVHLHLDDGTNTFADICVTTVHLASITKIYNFANFGSTQLAPVNCLYIPLPPFPLLAGYRIFTETDNRQGGDNFSAPQLLVEEWIEP